MKCAAFKIVAGKNKGQELVLKPGQCCALGRSLFEKTQTKIMSVDANISLDEISKNIVMQYVSQQFNRKPGGDSQGKTDVSGFVRLKDYYLNDKSVSRLHSMVFCDKKGAGIVDLVSKNGTYINGVEVESKMLGNEDLITIGSTKIRVSLP